MILTPVIVGEPKALRGGQNYNLVYDQEANNKLEQIISLLGKVIVHLEAITDEQINMEDIRL